MNLKTKNNNKLPHDLGVRSVVQTIFSYPPFLFCKHNHRIADRSQPRASRIQRLQLPAGGLPRSSQPRAGGPPSLALAASLLWTPALLSASLRRAASHPWRRRPLAGGPAAYRSPPVLLELASCWRSAAALCRCWIAPLTAAGARLLRPCFRLKGAGAAGTASPPSLVARSHPASLLT
jgi:hypothetical protein